MNIHELVQRTGITERQVRYLISEGIVPAPRGGRSNADYGDDHLATIQRYLSLRKLGFRPEVIRVLLETGKGVPISIAPGLTLLVDPAIFTGVEFEHVIERLKAAAADTIQEPPHARTRHTIKDRSR